MAAFPLLGCRGWAAPSCRDPWLADLSSAPVPNLGISLPWFSETRDSSPAGVQAMNLGSALRSCRPQPRALAPASASAILHPRFEHGLRRGIRSAPKRLGKNSVRQSACKAPRMGSGGCTVHTLLERLGRELERGWRAGGPGEQKCPSPKRKLTLLFSLHSSQWG